MYLLVFAYLVCLQFPSTFIFITFSFITKHCYLFLSEYLINEKTSLQLFLLFVSSVVFVDFLIRSFFQKTLRYLI